MLIIENVTLTVGKKILIQSADAKSKAGTFTALLGPNGAGKSTLLKILCHEINTYSGNIIFHNKPLQEWSTKKLARHIAVLPQSSQLVFPFTAEEVVQLGTTPLSISRSESRAMVLKIMQLMDCSALAKQSFMELSGGQKQRVQLARVLLQLSQAEKEPLLLLDEPTSAQDLRQQHAILRQVRSLAHDQQYGVISVLHDMNHALRYADEAWLMSEGNIVNMGNPRHCLSHDTIQTVWKYSPQIIKGTDKQIYIH